MRNRRFVLMILDSRGGKIRRVGIHSRSVWTTVGVSVVVAGMFCAFVLFGGSRKRLAAETPWLRQENAELAALARELREQLPGLRLAAMQAEVATSQVLAKSGLAIEPRMLAIGPLTAEERARPHLLGAAASKRSTVLESEPMALPLETYRVAKEASAIRRSLGALLEYFHDAQRLLSNTPSVRPVSRRVTSPFGKRTDPIDGGWVMHKGIDLGSESGTEILAPADGVVIWTGRRGGYGKTIVIDHGYGIQTHYAHLQSYHVRVGDRVRRGDSIARVGNTGRSTGPHLHYEVRRLGVPVDPMRFVLD